MIVTMVVLVAALASASPASAATFQVSGTADSTGVCDGTTCTSIRQALASAASSAGPDTIVVPAGDYQLVNGQLTVDSEVTLTGAGARSTIVRGNRDAFRVVAVLPGAGATITGATLRDGRADDTGNPTFFPGGIIRNSGTLTLERVRVTGGIASSGGGIANTGGTLTVARSLIDHNDSSIGGGDAGALLNFGGAKMTVRNSTIANNTATLAGAYLSWGAPAGSPNSGTFEHVTIADNVAGSRGIGGVGYDPADSLTFRASLIASNTGNGVASNCGAAPASAGFNVESGSDCGFERTGGAVGLATSLTTPAEGDTDVLAITVESPARDLVEGNCPSTDQRGVTRPQGGRCDAGAYELSVEATPVVPPTPTPSSPTPTPSPATLGPTPTPTPSAVPTPVPQAGKQVVVRPVSGKVFVRPPGSTSFVDLTKATGVPLNSIVDTKQGRITLTFQPTAGGPVQRAMFYGGIFRVTQRGSTLDLTLVEELAPCATKKQAKAAAKQPKTRRLWGDGKGRFRTLGQYSAATVRGTAWLVQDDCAGTLTRVKVGVVAVRDFRTKKTILVRAGKRYVAKPRR